jgi:cell envelope opacity-associated protein A
MSNFKPGDLVTVFGKFNGIVSRLTEDKELVVEFMRQGVTTLAIVAESDLKHRV